MILPFQKTWPEIHETAFIAPSSDVIGKVKVGEHSSVWFNCVIRGDVNTIQIGNRTNIQDLTICHVTRNTAPLKVGDDVTVGHRVVLHGCTIGNRVLIGMGAVIMDHAEISDDCFVGAGALVTQGKKFPPRSLIMGSPARVARELNEEELAFLKKSAANYVKDSAEYKGFILGPSRWGDTRQDLENFDDFDSEDEK